jgi:hypothetical protein
VPEERVSARKPVVRPARIILAAALTAALATVATAVLDRTARAKTAANVPPGALKVAGMAGASSDFAWRCSADLHQMVIATTYLQQRRVVLAPKLCRWLTERKTNPRRFGIAAHIVIHEAAHTRGLRLENVAEDRAQLLTPRILARVLHGPALDPAVRGAAWYHRQLPWRYLVRVEQPHFTTSPPAP